MKTLGCGFRVYGVLPNCTNDGRWLFRFFSLEGFSRFPAHTDTKIPRVACQTATIALAFPGGGLPQVEHSNLVQDTNLRLVETESDFTRSIGLMRSKFGSFS